jgi:hypothetical protein
MTAFKATAAPLLAQLERIEQDTLVASAEAATGREQP